MPGLPGGPAFRLKELTWVGLYVYHDYTFTWMEYDSSLVPVGITQHTVKHIWWWRSNYVSGTENVLMITNYQLETNDGNPRQILLIGKEWCSPESKKGLWGLHQLPLIVPQLAEGHNVLAIVSQTLTGPDHECTLRKLCVCVCVCVCVCGCVGEKERRLTRTICFQISPQRLRVLLLHQKHTPLLSMLTFKAVSSSAKCGSFSPRRSKTTDCSI